MLRVLITLSLAVTTLTACSPEAANTESLSSPGAERFEIRIAPSAWMMADGQTHFNKRVAEIDALGPKPGGVLLVGDSITEGWMWRDFPYDGPVANHGVGWDVSEGVLARNPQILREDPKAVFVMIGTNDLSYDRTPDQILPPLKSALVSYAQQWPNAKIYLQSVLPRNGQWDKSVTALNAALPNLAKDRALAGRVLYIDLTPIMGTSPDALRETYTYDGIHLTDEGYAAWGEALRPYLPRD